MSNHNFEEMSFFGMSLQPEEQKMLFGPYVMSKLRNSVPSDVPYAIVNMEDIPEEKSPILEKLCLLKSIANIANNVHNCLSLEEIGELMLDLGSSLMGSQEDIRRNPEVFEDPLNKSDVLGNVQMIHKALKAYEHENLENFGEALVIITHSFLQANRKQKVLDFTSDEVYQDLDPFDDARSEDLLEAKKTIRRLRKEIGSLDRRNESLWYRLKFEQNQKQHSAKAIPPKRGQDKLVNLKFPGHEEDDKKFVSVDELTPDANGLHDHGEKESLSDTSRKRDDSRFSTTQSNCLSFE